MKEATVKEKKAEQDKKTENTMALRVSEDGLTLYTSDDLDLSTKAAFVAALTPMLETLRDNDAPHLDMTGTDFMDSAGLEALIWAHRCLQASGSRLHLRVRAASQIGRVLRISHMPLMFQIDFTQ